MRQPSRSFQIVLQAARASRSSAGVPVVVRRCDGRSVVARDQLAQLAEAVGDDVEDRAIGREWNVLLERGDAQTRRRPHRARCPAAARRSTTRSSVDFPEPLASDDRDTLARLDLQSGLIEQR